MKKFRTFLIYFAIVVAVVASLILLNMVWEKGRSSGNKNLESLANFGHIIWCGIILYIGYFEKNKTKKKRDKLADAIEKEFGVTTDNNKSDDTNGTE